MKAKVRETGEIVDVFPTSVVSSDIIYTTNDKSYKGWELDFINVENKSIDWEQRRYELAKAAMQGLCANSHDIYVGASFKEYATWAKKCADALIEELKEK